MAATAVRVFGSPITDGTPAQRALAAKNSQNTRDKLDLVLQHVNQQQKVVAAQEILSFIFGRLYNATGNTITYVMEHIWRGLPGLYPQIIENGQWAIFFSPSSEAAVVYNLGVTADSMIAWNISEDESRNNAYCEMNYPGYFYTCDWDEIRRKLRASGPKSYATYGGCSTKVSISEGPNPLYTANFYSEV